MVRDKASTSTMSLEMVKITPLAPSRDVEEGNPLLGS